MANESVRVVKGLRIPWNPDSEHPATHGALTGSHWIPEKPFVEICGRKIQSVSVLRLPTANSRLLIKAVSVCDYDERSIGFHSSGSIIATCVGPMTDIRFGPDYFVEPDSLGFVRFQDPAFVRIYNFFEYKGESHYYIGNFGVEVTKLEQNLWRLSFCEGIRYIQFDAMVFEIALYEGDPDANAQWWAKYGKKAMKRKTVPKPDYWLSHPSDVINLKD